MDSAERGSSEWAYCTRRRPPCRRARPPGRDRCPNKTQTQCTCPAASHRCRSATSSYR